MERINVENPNMFGITNVAEFTRLPKNKVINVNSTNCKILFYDDCYFGVEFYYKNSSEIKDIESALVDLRVVRDTKYVSDISEMYPLIQNITPDDRYCYIFDNGYTQIALSVYHLLPYRDNMNNIQIAQLIADFEIVKECSDDGNNYTVNRNMYFDVYGSEMLPYRHIYFTELDDGEIEEINSVFQKLSNTFKRSYTFHMYGDPIYTFKPTAKK